MKDWYDNMINFTVGPVQMDDEIRQLGLEQIPYFRTAEFSALMKENEQLLLKFFKAPKDSRAVFLTGSGTAAMEAAVINSFGKTDRLLIVNGGSFGARFVEIAKIHGIPYTEIRLNYGETLKEEQLSCYEHDGYTGFLVNMHETSTGVLYDMKLISAFCKRNKLYLIVDCISSFIADEFDMEELGVDIALTGSQKAMALPPGVSILILNPVAVQRVTTKQTDCLYLNLADHLKDMERGQTPFTPAVGILIQMNQRLKMLDKVGIQAEHERIRLLAEDFRRKVSVFDFSFLAETMSNAVTALEVQDGVSTREVFEILKDEYGIWICPNGGELGKRVFRVGHIGALTGSDTDHLIAAFKDMQSRGII